MNETTPHETRKPRVAVVFGGRSSEHGISCVTAGSVLAAIDRETYDVVPVGIATDGRWVLEADEPARLAIRGNDLPEVDAAGSTVALMGAATGTELVVADATSVPSVIGEVDVVFPLLHGPWGEDGTLQGMLEMAGVRYVGSGVLASAIGMDKAYMKVVLQAAGLPVTPGITVTRREWEQDPVGVRTRVEELGFPSFAKPARAGSSMGISKVHDAGEVDEALEEAFRHDPKVLVEQSMEGAREVECGVLGTVEGPPETSRPGEVRTGGDHEFYDFEAKYLADQHTEIDIPADLDAETEQSLRAMAVRAFEALSCEGLARVDFFVLSDGALVINELNTMPGFTPTSMYPQMWAASGLAYPELVDRLVQLALRRDTGLR
ncbi:D-alanine--D-alanine ligase [Nocardioides KLBMP 9356]|uniref:D-alanine--D-alanine ligase n=1 Tax=Nocardioides potassii TaxID=2911371 RepID=A0ABS9H9G4_9ACTN|nr:D-alanine--D-alanine ligase family protein [Nocardioides potassii]MCF6377124.1 D-alanine--D-alanine ligase [Nocardioides potassii]